jgi:nicotinate-nucleotide pyrophosphorylase (carboxylating)
VRRALEEDLGAGDVTTDATVASDLRARGVFLVKADCVLAGLDVAIETFRQLDPGISRRGDRSTTGTAFVPVKRLPKSSARPGLF